MTRTAQLFGLSAALLGSACGSDRLLGWDDPITVTPHTVGVEAADAGLGGGPAATTGGGIGPHGGTLATLDFAIVGGAWPANIDDTSGYPSWVASKIWQGVQAASPRPAFAITTGNYMFANPSHLPGTQAAQLDLYLTARASFGNIVFPALGVHDCNGLPNEGTAPGLVASNCGLGNADGLTANYTSYVAKMLAPLGQTRPYYAVKIDGTYQATGETWTAKLVVIACNAWSRVQADWLEGSLADPTTYTFVVRHEGIDEAPAPCILSEPNADAIMGRYPFTLLIAGRPDTFAYYPKERQVIVGNGGAPLQGDVSYGYVLATQRVDGAIAFSEIDSLTGSVEQIFAVNPDGTPAL